MLTSEQRKYLARVHDETSLEAQAWITERLHEAAYGNPWAEEQCKAFIKIHRRLKSGVRTLMYLESGPNEQLHLPLDE